MKRLLSNFAYISTFLLLVLSGSALLANEQHGSLSIQWENDLFNDSEHYSDQYYTNGLKASLTFQGKRDTGQEWAEAFPGMIDDVKSDAGCRDKVDWLHNISIGHNMFTPVDIWDPFLIKDDRPFAGWLYVNFGLLADKRGIAKEKCRKTLFGKGIASSSIDTLELSLGVVGPASQADDLQITFHDIFGGVEPKGWPHQLKNEPVVNLTYNRQWNLFNDHYNLFDFDMISHAGFALGTVYTYANTGATVRVGTGLNADYGPPRIRPSVPGSDFIKLKGAPDLSVYAFAGVEGRAIARNIFLDGNTFVDSHSVDKYPYVGDIQAGAVLRYKDVRFSLTNTFRSREFKKQRDSSEFGAVTLTIPF